MWRYNLFYKRELGDLSKMTNNLYIIGDKLQNEIVVICEQGYGDHIQFSRYLYALKERVDKVYLASLPSLAELFKKNFIESNLVRL